MTLRRLSVLVLLAVLCGTVSPRATATIAARTWSVAPVDDVQLGDPLTFAGSGCLKRGVPASHMEIVIDTNYGLLGYVPVAANGTWHLVSRVTPSPGSFLMVLHASCFDDGGHMASAGAKLFFKYPQVLAVHYAGGLSLTVYPLRALAETPFHAPVAFFTYPTASGVGAAPGAVQGECQVGGRRHHRGRRGHRQAGLPGRGQPHLLLPAIRAGQGDGASPEREEQREQDGANRRRPDPSRCGVRCQSDEPAEVRDRAPDAARKWPLAARDHAVAVDVRRRLQGGERRSLGRTTRSKPPPRT